MSHSSIDRLAPDPDSSGRAELENLQKILVRKEQELERERGERIRAEAAAKLNEDRLDALLGLSQLRNATEEALDERVLEDSVRLTGSELGYLHFVNTQENGFGSYVWSRGAAEVCEAVRRQMDFSLQTAGIWADSLRTRCPAICNEYPSTPGTKGLPDRHIAISRIMSVPIMKEDRIVAILGVANKPEPYNEADQRQLLLFGNRLWSILEAKRTEISLAEANGELHRLAVLDSLTGLANRRGLSEYLEMLRREEIGRAHV